MLLTILYNFCILSTISILIYWPFLNQQEKPTINRYQPYIIGFNFGVAGLLLTILSSQVAFGIMINSRIIPLLLSGLLGGPIALAISGLIMGIARFFLVEFTPLMLFINGNFILVVLLLFFFGRKYRFNDKNIFYYFWISIIEMSSVILSLVIYHGAGYPLVLFYTTFTIISFYSIYFIINRIKETNQKINETKYLSKIDYLTQLPNSKTIEKYIVNALDKEPNFTILLLHINDFKIVTSTYGYQFGDVVIKQLAQSLQEYANKNDAFVGKLSGEEFIIILKDVAPAIAVTEAHAINKWITQQPFESPQHGTVHITTSIGLASFPDNGADYYSLIKNLNAAQLHAKSNFKTSYFHANNLMKK